jgi:ParB-like chromosome segregation protein Spo0J
MATKKVRQKVSASKPEGLKVPVPQQVKLADLQFAPYNPRSISREVMGALKASLRKHGMVLTLVVQKLSGAHGPMVLIGGHQRVRAMRELCAAEGWPEPAEVSAVVLDVGDAEAKQLNVSLNNIEGEFDPYKLGEMFRDIRPAMTMDDVLATGFAPVEIDEMINLLASPDDAARLLEENIGDLGGFGSSITLSIEFATVESRDEAKSILKAAAQHSGKKPGDLMLRAVKASDVLGKLGGPRHKGGDGKSKAKGAPRAAAPQRA